MTIETMHNTSQATLRGLRMSPRKVRLLAGLIRGRRVPDAKLQLQFAQKFAARPLLKLLQSAVANAVENHDLERDSLVVKSVTVDGGPILYRWQPKAMGRATPIRKRTSHVTIVLAGKIDEKKSKIKNQKSEAKIDRSEVKPGPVMKEVKKPDRLASNK